jgi:aerobic-type carbon monoxide dehydrogenase small subunit (CoxS/CutS family)
MIQLKVNGVEQSFSGDPEMPLLWCLRDVLGLTGSKFGPLWLQNGYFYPLEA